MSFGFAMREKKKEDRYFTVHKNEICFFSDRNNYKIIPCIGVGLEDYFIVERLGRYVPEDRLSATLVR